MIYLGADTVPEILHLLTHLSSYYVITNLKLP